MKPRIVVADDHEHVLQQLLAMLQPEFDVVATAQNGAAALTTVKQFSPDLLVLDIAMSPVNGFEVARALRAAGSDIIIIVVTSYCDPEIESAAFAAGANGFVWKSRLRGELLSTIRTALAQRAAAKGTSA